MKLEVKTSVRTSLVEVIKSVFVLKMKRVNFFDTPLLFISLWVLCKTGLHDCIQVKTGNEGS